MNLEIVQMEARHAAMIQRQDSQATTFGLAFDLDEAYGAELLEAPGEHWAAVEVDGPRERVVAMFGFVEVFRHKQATAVAVFSGAVGVHHLAITRFAAEQIRTSHYRRVELITECADAEPLLERMPDLDPGELVEALTVPAIRTPGMRWAMAIGMKPAAVLRNYGASSETHMLFERIA